MIQMVIDTNNNIHMTKFEELVVSKKNYEEIAIFLGVSVGWVSDCLSSNMIPRRELREAVSFRDLIISDNSQGDTIRDYNYIKNNEL